MVAPNKSSDPVELFLDLRIFYPKCGRIPAGRASSMKKDDPVNQQRMRLQPDDGLGPTSDIGSRLRALYGAVQEEGVPDQLLDLLEKLDSAEQAQQSKQTTSQSGE